MSFDYKFKNKLRAIETKSIYGPTDGGYSFDPSTRTPVGAQGSQATKQTSGYNFGDPGLAEAEFGAGVLDMVLGSAANAQNYKAQAAQFESQAEMYRLQALDYDAKAEYEWERHQDLALAKEVEGEFDYASNVIQAQSTGVFSGSESVGKDTSLGAVLGANKKSYLNEAKKITERGAAMANANQRQAVMARVAQQGALDAADAAREAAGDEVKAGIFGAAGAIGGAVVGGPAGAAVGASAGSSVGRLL